MQSNNTLEIMQRFNRAFQDHDPTLLDELIAEDCVMESIQPAPNGTRYEGREACLAFWQALAAERVSHFDLEDITAMGDSAVIRWRFNFGDGGSVRGVNLMRVRDGLIVEALGYAKSPGQTAPLPE
ncbi:nuclear transport factor 2 family protein [Mesorhizobium retamae]|uniref:Nuclear transport factor 2 family protein n=1 Tax=Mesorhizobium retamae TaxID=2912854 RepID=A0ABS9QHC7_9HYPH|nr:nuclear transport factor 2 family protein [Mesorhizobium sp. IRAMC:0171]MCG7506760.1 nuclear transport factor 2 family protein [Mesorhizobium sp. IRAMC:0171]